MEIAAPTGSPASGVLTPRRRLDYNQNRCCAIMNTKSPKVVLLIALVLAVSAALLVAVFASSYTRPSQADELAPEWSDLRQRLEVSNGRWLLVLYTQSEPHRRVRYLDLVLERLRRNDVEAAVITPRDWRVAAAAEGEHRQRGRSRLVLDDGELASMLGLPLQGRDSGELLWLLAPDDRLDLHLAVASFQDDELRQVLEKGVLGEVGGAEGTRAVALSIDDPFPAVRVREVATDDVVDLAQLTARYFVFFTAECTGCSLSAQLEMLAEATASPAAGELAAVFSSRFGHAEVAREAALHHVIAPLYVAVDELPGIEDLYYSKGLFADAVVAERSGGRVASLQPLRALLRQEVVR